MQHCQIISIIRVDRYETEWMVYLKFKFCHRHSEQEEILRTFLIQEKHILAGTQVVSTEGDSRKFLRKFEGPERRRRTSISGVTHLNLSFP